MDIKVKIYVNNFTVDMAPYIAYAQALFAPRGYNMTYEVVNVNVTGYHSVDVQVRPGVWYYVLEGADGLVELDPAYDIIMFVFNQDEWSNRPGSPYRLQPDTPTSDTVNINGQPFINFGIDPLFLTGSEITFAHEQMHALGYMSDNQGFPVQDCMDSLIVDGVAQTYYLNNDPTNVNSNFTNMFERLTPWLFSKKKV
jgi:hypothetical protein